LHCQYLEVVFFGTERPHPALSSFVGWFRPVGRFEHLSEDLDPLLRDVVYSRHGPMAQVVPLYFN
jgi:hypothetical protein